MPSLYYRLNENLNFFLIAHNLDLAERFSRKLALLIGSFSAKVSSTSPIALCCLVLQLGGKVLQSYEPDYERLTLKYAKCTITVKTITVS